MARRGDEDDTAPKLQNFQIGSSWIPSTPGKKPDSTPDHPICANWQQNQHVVETNCLEPKLWSRVNQVTQANWSDTGGNFACYNSVNASGDEVDEAANSPVCRDALQDALRSFDTWEANSRVHGDDFQRNDNKFSMDDADTNLTHMSFGNLLALAHVGGNTSAENAVTKTAGFHPYRDVGSHSMISFGNPSVPELGSLLGEKFDAGLKRVPGILRDGSSTPSRPLFDLNSPPRTVRDAALSISTPSHFQPITPEKTNKAEQRRESAIIDLTTDIMPLAKGVQTSTITADEVNILYEKKEHSQLVADQLSETTLTQLSENHKPDKGGTAEADLTKTPQLKPRRRKHRPKVIIEGQTKGTPKPHLEKPSAPQESPVIKRKYVRRKAVNSQNTSPVEGGFIESDSNKNTPSKDTPAGKRKYVRKKISGELEGITGERTTEETEPNTIRNTRSSCRRSLNFISDSQLRDESSSYTPSSNFNILQAENVSANDPSKTPNVHCRRGPEVVMEKNDMGIAYELTKTAYQDLQDYLSRPEIHPPSCSSPINPDSLYNGYGLTDQSVCTKGKCQIVFSDVTHDKEANIAQVSESIDGRQRTPKSTNNSICSSSYSMQEKQASGFKRQIMGTRVEAELCSTNASGAFYGSMQSYLPIFSKNADKNDCTFGMHFPTIYKKKRTEKGFNAATSSSQYTATTSNSSGKLARHNHRDSFTHMSSWTNQGFFIAPCEANNLLKTNLAPDGVQIGRQVFEDLLALGPTEKIRRKRSKGPTRPRNLASLLEICEGKPVSPGKAAKTSKFGREIEIHREPFTCMEALVADTCSTMKTKKRSKRSLLMNSASHNFNNHHEFSTKSIGPPLALTWKYTSPIDSVIQLLNQLDLNAEFSLVSAQKQNAFMACQMNYQEQHALVPFQRGGAVVPFDGSFEEVKRKRPRPKVELDNETARVWKLLLENINSEGIDGTDEEKAKWWEEERRVFNGRADSFIARMHLVQGDRRFSPWKGSVLDSVIGVFLTQNVSDHLSSSAFMSLAARFPIDSKTNTAELHEAREITKGKEPEICMPDSDETFGLSNNDLPESGRPEMLQHFEDSENRGVRSIKCSSDGSIPKDDFRGQLPDVEKTGPVVSNESAPNKSASMFEEGRDMDDTVSSQASVISSQNTADSPITQTTERTDSCSLSNSEEEPAAVGDKSIGLLSSTSFVKLLEMAGSMRHGVFGEGGDKKMSDENQLLQTSPIENPWGYPAFSAKPSASCCESAAETSLEAHTECLNFSKKYSKDSASSSGKETDGTETSGLSAEFAPNATSEMSMTVNSEGLKLSSPNAHQSNNDKVDIGLNKVEKPTGQVPARSFPENTDKVQGIPGIITCHQNLIDVTASSSITENSRNSELKEVNSSKTDPTYLPVKTVKEPKAKGTRTGKAKQNPVDWDNLRKQAQESGRKSVKTGNTMDSVDWDAVRCADVNEIAFTIKERGMNNMLAERIKDFLNRLVRDHESIDLEWLRDIPPDKAKEYLLSIRGLGLKSTECVRLLTLHHLAFPVDTNVGRIAVRLGWVPLQPLPESLQLHLLELYPVLESIQKYLWPRLCKLDQRTLYELHYQMITFGKVFCTKSKPNCNACPMRGECRHFASAFASARLALPAPEEKSIVNAAENKAAGQNPIRCGNTLQLPSPQGNHMCTTSGVSNSHPIVEEPASPEPIVEVPDSPEPEHTQVLECDIEDMFAEDPDEIPTIHLNIEQFTQNLQKVMQQNTELQEGDMSKALVALNPEAASIPMPKLKNMSRLRTEHLVYELPDSHPLLEGLDKREPDDPSPYLLAIWTPGETVDSIEPPETRCSSQESGKMCTDETCVSCSSLRELKSQTVRGTLLIPCRTAMRGSFPLNGTYFQVNEVFSDHESSLTPMDVPREWLWNLPRRTVYFGTSIPTIFKGLTTEGIQYCFWRGFVCVRGFDRKTRAPRPLIARLHFPASKLASKGKGKTDDN